MKLPTCDCLNECGDDSRLKDGRVLPCPTLAERQRVDKVRAGIVVEKADFDKAGKVLTITYTKPLNGEQQAMVFLQRRVPS